jgi:hypothetical protein
MQLGMRVKKLMGIVRRIAATLISIIPAQAYCSALAAFLK